MTVPQLQTNAVVAAAKLIGNGATTDQLWAGEGDFPGIRELLRMYPGSMQRVNAHCSAEHSIPTIMGLNSTDAVNDDVKNKSFRLITKALIRYGTKPGPDGAWDQGLSGSVPTGQVGGSDDPVVLPPAPKPVRKPAPKTSGGPCVLPDDHVLMVMLRASESTGDAELIAKAKEKVEAEIKKLEAARPAVDVAALKEEVLQAVDGKLSTMSNDVAKTIRAVSNSVEEIRTEMLTFTGGVRSVIDNKLSDAVSSVDAKLETFTTTAQKAVDESCKAAQSAVDVIAGFRQSIVQTQSKIIALESAQPKASAAKVNLDVDDVKRKVADILNAQIKDVLATGQPPSNAASMPGEDERLEAALIKPVVDPSFFFDEEDTADLLNEMRLSRPQNLMMEGPSGCGKTTWPFQFAARICLPVLCYDAQLVREARAWFGYRDPVSLQWIQTAFTLAIKRGNCVIVIDEINRGTPLVLNGLMSTLDDRRSLYNEESGERIVVGPGIVFIATRNVGNEFTGTTATDAALDNRFTRRIKVNYLPPDRERDVLVARTGIDKDDALRLAELANDIRAKAGSFGQGTLMGTVSTRQLIGAAGDFVVMRNKYPNEYGRAVRTLIPTIVNHFQDDGIGTGNKHDSDRAQVLQMVTNKFGAFA